MRLTAMLSLSWQTLMIVLQQTQRSWVPIWNVDVPLTLYREDGLYHCYQELLKWIPSLKANIAADSEDYKVKLIMKDFSANTSMLLATWPATRWTKVQMEPEVMMHLLWRWLLLTGSCILSPHQSWHLNPIQKLDMISIMMQWLGWSVQWITTGPICSMYHWLQFHTSWLTPYLQA